MKHSETHSADGQDCRVRASRKCGAGDVLGPATCPPCAVSANNFLFFRLTDATSVMAEARTPPSGSRRSWFWADRRRSSASPPKAPSTRQQLRLARRLLDATEASDDERVATLASAAERVLAAGARGDDSLWEVFLEQRLFQHLVDLLQRPALSETARTTALQTLSLVLWNVAEPQALVFMLSNNQVNRVLQAFPLDVSISAATVNGSDHAESGGNPAPPVAVDLLPSFVSLLRTLSVRLDAELLPLLFDERTGTFVLLACALQLLHYPDRILRAAASGVVLQVAALSAAARSLDAYLAQVLRAPSNFLSQQLQRLTSLLAAAPDDRQTPPEARADIEDTFYFVNDLVQHSGRRTQVAALQAVRDSWLDAVLAPAVRGEVTDLPPACAVRCLTGFLETASCELVCSELCACLVRSHEHNSLLSDLIAPTPRWCATVPRADCLRCVTAFAAGVWISAGAREQLCEVTEANGPRENLVIAMDPGKSFWKALVQQELSPSPETPASGDGGGLPEAVERLLLYTVVQEQYRSADQPTPLFTELWQNRCRSAALGRLETDTQYAHDMTRCLVRSGTQTSLVQALEAAFVQRVQRTTDREHTTDVDSPWNTAAASDLVPLLFAHATTATTTSSSSSSSSSNHQEWQAELADAADADDDIGTRWSGLVMRREAAVAHRLWESLRLAALDDAYDLLRPLSRLAARRAALSDTAAAVTIADEALADGTAPELFRCWLAGERLLLLFDEPTLSLLLCLPHDDGTLTLRDNVALELVSDVLPVEPDGDAPERWPLHAFCEPHHQFVFEFDSADLRDDCARALAEASRAASRWHRAILARVLHRLG